MTPIKLGSAKNLVYAATEAKPISNIPPNAIGVKIKLRAGELAKAYVRFRDGITVYCINDDGETWSLAFPQASNSRQVVPKVSMGYTMHEFKRFGA